jgi:hypothetical protein
MGFANDFQYKSLHLYALWSWQQGGITNNLTKLLYDFGQNAADYDIVEPDGQLRGAKRLANWSRQTSVYFEDATFLKLRELTLSVDLPMAWVNNLWGSARYVRFSVSGRNLLTFSGYTGFDPEVSNFGNQPIARNLDTGPYPPSRTFWFSIDLGL